MAIAASRTLPQQVTALDWTTGEPNAKYWAIHMLAKEMGFGVKSLFNATFSAAAAASPPPPVGTIGAAPSTAL